MMRKKEPVYKYSKVLLIDDSELDNFVNELTIAGHFFAERIFKSTSGRSALEFIDNLQVIKNGNPDVFPQVIFIDINMPMMDGFQFVEYFIKKNKPGSPKLVILTSSIAQEDEERTKGIAEDIIFLRKPLTPAMLDTI